MFRARGSKVLSLLILLMLTLAIVPVAFAAEVTVYVNKDPNLGTILTDSEGRTLYRFTRDTVNVASACYNACAVTWPPLLLDEGKNPVASEGVDGNLLGVLTRTDGTRQVMYNGMPLYYFANDKNAYETNGQRVRDVWFVVHPNTTTVGNQGVTLREAKNAALGPILTDGQGRTVYMFTKDSANHSVCYDGCATSWPPLLVGAVDVALDGIGGTVGTTLRDDGNKQATYEGKPLYYWFRDAKPGDTNGQNVGNVWFVVTPVAAAASAAPAPAPAAAPASLPKTGDSSSIPLGPLALVAALLVALGVLMSSRRNSDRV